MTKYLAIAFLFTGFLVGDAYADWLSDAKSLFKKKEPVLFLKCTGSLVSAGIYKLDPNTKKLSWVEDFNKMPINIEMDTSFFSETTVNASFPFKRMLKEAFNSNALGSHEANMKEIAKTFGGSMKGFKAQVKKMAFKNLENETISIKEKERRADIMFDLFLNRKSFVEIDRYSGEIKWTNEGFAMTDLFPKSKTMKSEVEHGKCIKLENKKF